jgi:hypothetical protein
MHVCWRGWLMRKGMRMRYGFASLAPIVFTSRS